MLICIAGGACRPTSLEPPKKVTEKKVSLVALLHKAKPSTRFPSPTSLEPPKKVIKKRRVSLVALLHNNSRLRKAKAFHALSVNLSSYCVNSKASSHPAPAANPPPKYLPSKHCAESDRKSQTFGQICCRSKIYQRSDPTIKPHEISKSQLWNLRLDYEVNVDDVWHPFCDRFYIFSKRQNFYF